MRDNELGWRTLLFASVLGLVLWCVLALLVHWVFRLSLTI